MTPGTEIHTREVVFEPLDAQVQRSQGNEPIFLRCSKELLEPKSGWYVSSLQATNSDCANTSYYGRIMYSYLKPESVRQHPEATVRPWATCQVMEDALSFASALGYVYAS